MKGQMGHGMEDYIVADTKTVKGHNLGLYAIFDGHSGRDVADYLQNHLFDNILSQVLNTKLTNSPLKDFSQNLKTVLLFLEAGFLENP